MTTDGLVAELQKSASDTDAVNLQRFFKTGPGEYGEGDQFIGVRVPVIRRICREFKDLPLSETKKLLASPIHEHRLAATIIMGRQYRKAPSGIRQQLFRLYLYALDAGHINNWDIVDTSCEHIIGVYARERGENVLFDLAKRDGIWHKRVAIVSCFAWLRRGDVGPTMELAELLWPEQHDLLQKATSWMLREAGKRIDQALLLDFLDRHAYELPRTCLRYAIEKLTPTERKHYMEMKRL